MGLFVQPSYSSHRRSSLVTQFKTPRTAAAFPIFTRCSCLYGKKIDGCGNHFQSWSGHRSTRLYKKEASLRKEPGSRGVTGQISKTSGDPNTKDFREGEKASWRGSPLKYTLFLCSFVCPLICLTFQLLLLTLIGSSSTQSPTHDSSRCKDEMPI